MSTPDQWDTEFMARRLAEREGLEGARPLYPPLSPEHASEVARSELADESFRAQVELAKVKIRAQRAKARWWHEFIPYTITIRRREP